MKVIVEPAQAAVWRRVDTNLITIKKKKTMTLFAVGYYRRSASGALASSQSGDPTRNGDAHLHTK